MSSFYVFTVIDNQEETYITTQDLPMRLGHNCDIDCEKINPDGPYCISNIDGPRFLLSSELINERGLTVIHTQVEVAENGNKVKPILEALLRNRHKVKLFKEERSDDRKIQDCYILFKVLDKDEWLFYKIKETNAIVLKPIIGAWKMGQYSIEKAIKLEHDVKLGWIETEDLKPVPKYLSSHLSPAEIIIMDSVNPTFNTVQEVFEHLEKRITI